MSLTLPGTLPGLLRRGSPLSEQGVVVGINPEMEDGRTHLVCFHEGYDDWMNPVELDLDLEDATGRAHAAWWLAGQMKGEPDGLTRCIDGVELLHCEQDGWTCTVHTEGVFYRLDVSYLDNVTTDPREALRLVCLHVGGAA